MTTGEQSYDEALGIIGEHFRSALIELEKISPALELMEDTVFPGTPAGVIKSELKHIREVADEHIDDLKIIVDTFDNPDDDDEEDYESDEDED